MSVQFKNTARKAFWYYTGALILFAILPINGPQSRLNNTYILYFRLDYVVHVCIFVLWVVLLKQAFYPGKKSLLRNRRNEWLFLIFVVILFAFFSESIQYLLPYRSFNINDLAANFLGIVIGLALVWLQESFTKKKTDQPLTDQTS